jgi:hypothetical protein
VFALDGSSRSRLRRIFPIQDLNLRICLRLGALKAVGVLKLLFAPGRNIAIPTVLYGFAQGINLFHCSKKAADSMLDGLPG